jgi:hypothetical protein
MRFHLARCIPLRETSFLQVRFDLIHPSETGPPSWPLALDFQAHYSFRQIVFFSSAYVPVRSQSGFLQLVGDGGYFDGLPDGVIGYSIESCDTELD